MDIQEYTRRRAIAESDISNKIAVWKARRGAPIFAKTTAMFTGFNREKGSPHKASFLLSKCFT